jgi:hypothetical protein
MRKLTVASLAVAAVISAGAGAAAASTAGPASGRTTAAEHASIDRHPTRAARERSSVRDRSTAQRHEASRDRAHGSEARAAR